MTFKAWMGKFKCFLERLSKQWNLPWLQQGTEQRAEGGAWITIKLTSSINDAPIFIANPRATAWESESGRVWVQTDNQQVGQVFDGLSRYEPGAMRPVRVRIARSLYGLLEEGKMPRMNSAAFVEWDPRELNTLADHAANMALDEKTGWHRVEWKQLQQAVAPKKNLRLCVDGALHGDRSSAAGFALIAYPEEAVLCRAGRQLGKLTAAFVAEMLALEWAMNILVRLIGIDINNITEVAGQLIFQ